VKSKRMRSNPAALARYLFLLQQHPIMRRSISASLWILFLAGWAGLGQPATLQKNKESLANQFLIYGNVFTEQGFLLADAEVQVRRASEHKQRWTAYSDRRGEFAVRVPKGDQYEIAIKAKGYTPLTRTVDARSGDREDIVFRMQPAAEGKKK